MVKYKCVKMKCPECKTTGTIQLFMNNNREIRYARTRHYSHTNKESRKPQFTYCKIEDLVALKTLLLNKGIQFSTDRAKLGQAGQWVNFESHDQQLKSLDSICQNIGAGSSVRIEHHPPKVGVVGSNPTPPAGF
jgi:hypothetical protein